MVTDKYKTLVLEKHRSSTRWLNLNLHQPQPFITAGVPFASTAPDNCRAHSTFNAVPATVPLRPKILLISDITSVILGDSQIHSTHFPREGEGQNQNFLKIFKRNL